MRNKINSEKQKAYNENLSEEQRRLRSDRCRERARNRTPEQIQQMIEKDKATRALWTDEQKNHYLEKQRESHKGMFRYTNGVRDTECTPDKVPEGFYPGTCHKANLKYIYKYNNMVFKGKPELLKYLQSNGFPTINKGTIDALVLNRGYSLKRFPELINKITREDFNDGSFT